MARQIHKLTAQGVKNTVEVGRLSDGGGLYLNISANGGRRWVFLFKWRGKPREMGLGSARDVTLSKARDLAAGARKLLAEGIDPLAQKQDAARIAEEEEKVRSVPNFGDAADRLLKAIDGEFRNRKHAAQWRSTLEVYCEPIRDIPTNEVTTEDVLKILSPIWREKAETAARLRGRIERVIDATRAVDANKKRWPFNPATWKGNLEPLLGKRLKLQRGHHAAMKWQELPTFFQRVQKLDSVSQQALAFLILNASRSGEVLGAIWSEIDFETSLWTIPGVRMKAGKTHVVPLSNTALAILKRMAEIAPEDAARRQSAYIFPGAKVGRPLSVMALAMRMRSLEVGHLTVHGFRSAFRDWAGDATTYPRELAEQSLAHKVGDAIENAYRRSTALEKRRGMMGDWENFLTTPAAKNVLQFPSSADLSLAVDKG
ncbi:tyrosine-type recombinase/integrase [Rhizobium tumorigenes]|uniref:Integrase arm-type DNA-binding domain-containing protein n=1 Tax=Rhizobium tumorigenes TaxID=2041385 RepID=A0AAF1KT86_9HYPH|nr:site-specific integrase [Rhizobium tumorigenes]WFR96880.1 integrase arm-type DNA-binding domain-containing protein [Rhizobium tumorigenes]